MCKIGRSKARSTHSDTLTPISRQGKEMEMQSQRSPSYPSGSLLDGTARGGASPTQVGRGTKNGATSPDNSTSRGVCNLAARPKRPWDDISPASNNETATTAFMAKQPTLSGVASAAVAATAKETSRVVGVEGTSKGVVPDLVGGGASPRTSTHGGGAKPSMGQSNSANTTAAGSSSILAVARSGGSGSEDDLTDSDEKSVSGCSRLSKKKVKPSHIASFERMLRRDRSRQEPACTSSPYE